MATQTVRIEGLEGVLKTLQQLPAEIVSKNGGPVRGALRKAAVVIQKEAQANVQKIIDQQNANGEPTESTGLLKKSIVVARGKKPASGNGETMLVKVRRNRLYPDKFQDKSGKVTAAKVGRLLEGGSERRLAMPWMRPAFEAKKNEALAVFVKDINERLVKIQKKLERQNRVKT